MVTSQTEREVLAARTAHEAHRIPERLRDHEPNVVLCDAGLAGYVSYWLSARRLDPDRRALLDWALVTLSAVYGRATDAEEREYVRGLRDLARALAAATTPG